DTASYANVRRFLRQGSLPPPDAVRIEEMINYFSYRYPSPEGAHPFAVHVEMAGCPWTPEHRLARIGIKGVEVAMDDPPARNLVFLLDVSGSMRDHNKLPLLREAMKLLARKLTGADRVGIVAYNNQARIVLDSTTCDNKGTVLGAIDALEAGGSTNGAAGIQMAYDIASANFVSGGVNRVILATDGDFNVGITERQALIELIEDRAKSKVFITVLGFGTGNLKDANLEALADKGNGNYHYIDSYSEAERVLVDQMGATLVTIAKDVK
ncbi:unnamed protein product, partial [marine sediment metagenome]